MTLQVDTTTTDRLNTTALSNINNDQQLTTLVAAAWRIAYTALWHTQELAATEQKTALDYITAFIGQDKQYKKNYLSFVQRVLLARQHIQTHPGSFAASPSQWFCTRNKKGFSRTAVWLAAVESTRTVLPGFKIHLKLFGEGVLQTVKDGKASIFHYWRSWLVQQNKQQLLNLYLSIVGDT